MPFKAAHSSGLDLAKLDRQGSLQWRLQMLGFRVGPQAVEWGCSREQAGHCWDRTCAEACNLIKPLESLPQARVLPARQVLQLIPRLICSFSLLPPFYRAPSPKRFLQAWRGREASSPSCDHCCRFREGTPVCSGHLTLGLSSPQPTSDPLLLRDLHSFNNWLEM